MIGVEGPHKKFEYVYFTLNQARRMHLTVFGNDGDIVRCGEQAMAHGWIKYGHKTRMRPLQVVPSMCYVH